MDSKKTLEKALLKKDFRKGFTQKRL